MKQSYDGWKSIKKATIGYLNEAIESDNDVDLLVADVLHQILPSLKISGYNDHRGEDSFVHDILAPLLDVSFSFNPNLSHFWANVGLNEVYKDLKPDYGVYVNGLSKRFVVLIAEFKPCETKQRQENDYIKVGREMRVMINQLLDIGIENPVVAGILVMKDILYTFKMHLGGPKTYIMTQLSSTKVVKGPDDLILLPTIITQLQQLERISGETSKKVQTHAKKVRDGEEVVRRSVPLSWICTYWYCLERENQTKADAERST